MSWIIVLIAIPFVIGFVGGIVKLSVLGRKPWDSSGFNWFQRAYFRSLAWHPVFVGVALGFLFWAFRWPQLFGDALPGYMLAAMFSSGVTIIAYNLLVKTIRRMIGAAGALVGAAPPGIGDDGGTDDRP